LLELCGVVKPGTGINQASQILDSGQAWDKFLRICAAQGGFIEPPLAPIAHTITATQEGHLQTIDNRRLARLAKLLGAPEAKVAGVDLHVRIGDQVKLGDQLFTMHAQAQGELDYASNYLDSHPPLLIQA
jgi:thymidine phosphorylase